MILATQMKTAMVFLTIGMSVRVLRRVRKSMVGVVQMPKTAEVATEVVMEAVEPLTTTMTELVTTRTIAPTLQLVNL